MGHVTSLPDLTLCFPLRPLLRTSADYAKGFGGKFGVETDKVDKSAVGFEYQGKTERHESQKGWCHHITSNHTVLCNICAVISNIPEKSLIAISKTFECSLEVFLNLFQRRVSALIERGVLT